MPGKGRMLLIVVLASMIGLGMIGSPAAVRGDERMKCAFTFYGKS